MGQRARHSVLGVDLHIQLSRAPITCHYVSPVEAMTVFRIFSKAWVPSLSEFVKAWPSDLRTVGHYSRKLGGEEEGRRVWQYLVSRALVCSDALECSDACS